ncbi:hypothetical protein [Clostridium tyrobutyricum]|uniref:hypothetical protein n=1 Tax=Clostridium tyrobutyricum TaxID=1519 RepID=UPI001C3D5AD2|nr:hypothetical protein [Clostridium tyrobutyricum]MBV4438580.1 hypothetical protein [Clostridium tyrobutyricum]
MIINENGIHIVSGTIDASKIQDKPVKKPRIKDILQRTKTGSITTARIQDHPNGIR